MHVLLSILLLAAPADPWGDRAVDLLTRYLQVDTTSPPGNELKGAAFLKDVLAREGIEARIDEFAPGRANLIATLEGNGKARPLILMNHMDVVPADATRWSVPPFAGVVKDGRLYGRGALDMKGEGVVQLVAFLRLAHEKRALDRDVVFIATADEEEDFGGIRRALAPEGFRSVIERAEYLLTEGGENRVAADGTAQYFSVQTAQKSPFWLTLKTKGRPGHGSVPIADSALNRLVRALDRIRTWRPEMRVLPTVAQSLHDLSGRMPKPQADWYRDVAKSVADPAIAPLLFDDPKGALLRDTVSITVVRAGTVTNVIPGTAEADLDVRLLPGTERDEFLARLRAVIDDPTVEIVPPARFNPPMESRIDTELFQLIRAVVGRHHPGVPVTTRMGSGATESSMVRPLGVVCYGFTPILLTGEEDDSQHADDERIPIESLRESVGVMYEVVAGIAGAK
jgi:acetylornithine deacetylase/succinyl-diaminopimelate desuccinylase-like protein